MKKEDRMAADNWEIIEEVYGELQAELLRGLLTAQGITVVLNQEGAGRAYGLNVGSLGATQIMVPTSSVERARQVLDDYYAGKFAAEEEEGPGENNRSE
jgi:hypothetical protein